MIIVILISVLFSIFSTAIMSYIAIATSTGPWIESTLVLFGIIVFRFLLKSIISINPDHAIGFATISGAIGGIIAVACGWAFPTLYFLDPILFNTWISDPYYFSCLLAVTVLISGGLGFIIANYLEHFLLYDQKIPFPIGELVNKMIFAHNEVYKTLELIAGVMITILSGVMQQYSKIIPRHIQLLSSFSYRIFHIPSVLVRFDLLPIFLSIGFITGHVIAIPLLFGLFSKIFIIEPIHKCFFYTITHEAFFLAFISGMVLQSALMSLFDIPHLVLSAYRQTNMMQFIKIQIASINLKVVLNVFKILSALSILIAYLSYFKFGLISQIYLLIFTLICVYQVLIIAGKTGLAPFPRFATFVLIPGMILFKFDAVQIMIVSTFVEVCCGVAVDVLFGRKMAQLSEMDRYKTQLFQLLGLSISAFSIGIIFYFLINRFGLGSSELFAQRAQTRALLVTNANFDYLVMLLGGFFNFSLRFTKINSLLVIGGLLMPPELSLCLIIGGLLTYLVEDKEKYYPFWSGMFAAGSLWMVFKAFL